MDAAVFVDPAAPRPPSVAMRVFFGATVEIIEVEYAPIPMDPFREPLGAESKPKVERS